MSSKAVTSQVVTFSNQESITESNLIRKIPEKKSYYYFPKVLMLSQKVFRLFLPVKWKISIIPNLLYFKINPFNLK